MPDAFLADLVFRSDPDKGFTVFVGDLFDSAGDFSVECPNDIPYLKGASLVVVCRLSFCCHLYCDIRRGCRGSPAISASGFDPDLCFAQVRLGRVGCGMVWVMAGYSFKCPHCGGRQEVALERLNGPVVCGLCGLPFTAEVPAGRLMTQHDGQWRTVSSTGRGGRFEEAEQTVEVFRPAALRQHPVQSLLLLLIGLAMLVGAVMSQTMVEDRAVGFVLLIVALIVAWVCGVILLVRVALTRFESLTVTTQRSIWARGILNRRSSEVQHDDIRNIQVAQSFVEQVVKVGTVAISSAGQDDMEITVAGISKPQAVVELVRAYQRRLVGGE